MDANLLQLLRFIHIVSASFWVGTSVTLAFFVYPALLTGDVGGARFLRQIMLQRKLAMVVVIVMLLAVLSGGYLYGADLASMWSPALTRRGLDYTLGGFFGILAFIVVLSVNAPTGLKLGAIVDSIGAENPTVEQSNQLSRLSRKLIIATRCVAILLLGSAALMALARNAR